MINGVGSNPSDGGRSIEFSVRPPSPMARELEINDSGRKPSAVENYLP
jgi:hypothetical protein